MASNFKTGIEITGNADGGVKAVDSAAAAVDRLNKKAAEGRKPASDYVHSLEDLELGAIGSEKAMAGLNAAIGGSSARFAAFAVGASALGLLYEATKHVVEETIKAEAAEAQLTSALRATGREVDDNREKLLALAKGLSDTSVYGSGAIVTAEALLVRFRNIGQGTLPRATAAAVDMAAALGIEVPEAAKKLGKALEDPLAGMTSLQKEGFRLTQSQKDLVEQYLLTGQTAKAQAVILGEVEGHFKGAAAAARDTLGGALAGLKNKISDLFEAKGGLPEAKIAIEELTKTLSDPKIKESIDQLAAGVSSAIAFMVRAASVGVQSIRKVGEGAAQLSLGINVNANPAASRTAPSFDASKLNAATLAQLNGLAKGHVDLATAMNGTAAAAKNEDEALRLDEDTLGKLVDQLAPLAKLEREHHNNLVAIEIATKAHQITRQQGIELSAEENRQYAERYKALDLAGKAAREYAEWVDRVNAATRTEIEETAKALETMTKLRVEASGGSDVFGRYQAFVARYTDAIAKAGLEGGKFTDEIAAEGRALVENVIAPGAGIQQTLHRIGVEGAGVRQIFATGIFGRLDDPAVQAKLEQFLANIADKMLGLKDPAQQLQDSFRLIEDSFSAIGGSAGNAFAGVVRGIADITDATQKQADVIAAAQAQNRKLSAQEVTAVRQYRSAAIGAYGDIADAAAGFFKEGSDGYKVLKATSAAFHAFEIAQEAASAVASLVASQTRAAGHATAAAAAGAEAVATQAAAGPYVGFALAAAMVAFLASLGISPRGSGGGSASVPNPTDQANTGRGTVLGDSNAQSASISNALGQLNDSAFKNLAISGQMLAQLQAINAGINGVGRLLYQANASISGGATPFSGYQDSTQNPLFRTGIVGNASRLAIDTFTSGLNELLGNLGGRILTNLGAAVTSAIYHTSTNLKETGLQFNQNQSVGDILGGQDVAAQYYALIERTHRVAGINVGRSTDTQIAAIDEELQQQLNKIVKGLGETMLDAVKALGGNLGIAQAELDKLKLGFDKINLKDLKGDELNKAISSVFSALGDRMVEAINGSIAGVDIAKFQQVGEGLLQTVVRVASNVEYATDALHKLGIAAVSLTDSLAGSTDLASDLIKASVQAHEALSNGLISGLGQMTAAFNGTADELVKFVGTLYDIRKAMNRLGVDGQQLNQVMADAAGGVDALASGVADFYDKFTPDNVKFVDEQEHLKQVLQSLGLALPATRAEMLALVQSFDLTTEAGQRAFGTLTGISGELDQYYKQLESASNGFDAVKDAFNQGVKQVADTLKSALASIDQARGGIDNAILSIRRQQSGFDEVAYQQAQVDALKARLGVGSVDEQIAAVNKVQAAISARYNAEYAALQKMLGYVTQLRSYVDGLKTSNLSPLKPADQFSAAQSAYQRILAAAQGGDATAIGQLQGAAQTYLEQARGFYASSPQYTAIFNSVTDAIEKIIGGTDVGSIQNQILAAQNSTVSELQSLNQNLDDAAADARDAAQQQLASLEATFNTQSAAIVTAIQQAADRASGDTKQALLDEIAALRMLAQTVIAAGEATVKAIQDNGQQTSSSGNQSAYVSQSTF